MRAINQNPKGPRPRAWKLGVTLSLTLLGVVVLAYGVLASKWPAVAAGAVLILSFGHAAAGARKVEAGAGKDTLKVKADYTEPPAREDSREGGLILPPTAEEDATRTSEQDR
jgi:hypothetical protein